MLRWDSGVPTLEGACAGARPARRARGRDSRRSVHEERWGSYGTGSDGNSPGHMSPASASVISTRKLPGATGSTT
jgi:hypothetical protein